MPIRIIAYCLLSGAVMIMAGKNVGAPTWWYVAGMLMASAFVPYLLRGPRESWKRFLGTWCALAVVTGFCTWTEALIFAPAALPHRTTMLAGSLFVYSLLAGAITISAWIFRLHPSESAAAATPVSCGRVALGLLSGGFAYLVYYYVFGMLFYQLLTKPYYTGNGSLAAAEQVVGAMGLWFPAIQIGRGALMTAAVLPIILGTRMNTRALAVYVGAVIWIIGGLAPLLPPNPFMPAELRWMHIAEIFTQNFTLGFTVVYLMRRMQPAAGKPFAAAA